MLKEPEILTKRTIPFGVSVPQFRFPRSQWIWSYGNGCYVRILNGYGVEGRSDDAYCMGDRLIFRSGDSWRGSTLRDWEKELLDLVTGLRWVLQADHQDWGCLFWSEL